MGKIVIVGLGPGAAGNLSLETMELLQSGAQVILRTAVHPTVAELVKAGVQFTSCDDFYEQGANFEEVYAHVVEHVLQAAQQGDVVYAVPGSPLVAERTVVLLREAGKLQQVELAIKPAMSFLDLAYVELGIDPIAGLRIIDAQDFAAAVEAGQYPLMITQVYSQLVASDLKLTLMEVLPDDYEIYFLRNLGLPDEECRPVQLFELDRQANIDHLTSVFVAPLPQNFEAAEEEEDEVEVHYASAEELAEYDEEAEDEENELEEDEPQKLAANSSYDDVDLQPLVDVMRILREPGGCPWDREQTHASIRSNMIEEVYEYLEAVDAEDVDGMREELGDVLMQIVFHARMAEEAGNFDLQDVIDEVTDKLIRRHPHVFGDTVVSGSDEVLVNWEAIKKEEKQDRVSVMDGVTKGLPALLRAYKLQGKAAKVGFDWQESAPVWAKVEEEIAELKEALAAKDQAAAEAELGDVLFALVNYARHQHIEPETALNGTNNRFEKRFRYVEKQVQQGDKPWDAYTLEQLDKFWEEAKSLEKAK